MINPNYYPWGYDSDNGEPAPPPGTERGSLPEGAGGG